jgi:hypothetical protein
MGLDSNGVRFLFYARGLGVNFERTAMIGRQSLDLTKAELRDVLQVFRHTVDNELIHRLFSESNGYGEPLLAHLGAKSIHSFDFSEYEGATHLHDMNQEIPTDYKGRYSVVLDGGSLEHVFNFPLAIKNCMEMLEVGGYYLAITPANNFMGHGFYQFSPEMYFSVFKRQNGFELVSLVAFEDRPRATWYSVKNPSETGGRVLLVNDWPVYLLVIARRLEKTTIFASTPQQSDYLSAWKKDKAFADQDLLRPAQRGQLAGLRNWVKRNVPFPVRHLLQVALQGYGFNPRVFQPIDPTVSKQPQPE